MLSSRPPTKASPPGLAARNTAYHHDTAAMETGAVTRRAIYWWARSRIGTGRGFLGSCFLGGPAHFEVSVPIRPPGVRCRSGGRPAPEWGRAPGRPPGALHPAGPLRE